MRAGYLCIALFSLSLSLSLSVCDASTITRYVSPVLDMKYELHTLDPALTTHSAEECALWCVMVPHCVAVSVAAAAVSDGSRTCQLKDHLVTLQKWLTPAPGHAYFHVIPPAYTRTGCFSHSTRENFDLLSAKYRAAHNDWEEDSFAQMIPGCAAMAWRRGYGVFGIEYAGECWATQTSVDYRADGSLGEDEWATCKYDVGIGAAVIAVFEFDP